MCSATKLFSEVSISVLRKWIPFFVRSSWYVHIDKHTLCTPPIPLILCETLILYLRHFHRIPPTFTMFLLQSPSFASNAVVIFLCRSLHFHILHHTPPTLSSYSSVAPTLSYSSNTFTAFLQHSPYSSDSLYRSPPTLSSYYSVALLHLHILHRTPPTLSSYSSVFHAKREHGTINGLYPANDIKQHLCAQLYITVNKTCVE